MNKKAALELGISTIVVLVIAMVVIAGGIAFIRTFFKQGEEELRKGFKITDFSIQPTREKPVIFAEGDEFTVKAGSQKTVKIGLLNNYATNKEFTVSFRACTSTGTTYSGAHPVPKINAIVQNLKPGEAKVFNIFVLGTDTSSTSLQKGNYICILEAKSDADTLGEKDVQIEVYQ